MIDLSKTIEAKSDQLNADDLLGGARILKITAVKAGTGEQPVSLSYEGDNGKPWKPSKGMRRVLVAAWGANGEAYAGRSVEVYCEATVKWAGEAVGGIRISRMSDLKTAIVIPLTLTRGKKTPVTIRPLEVPAKRVLTMEERQKKTLDMIHSAGIDITPEIESGVFSCSTPEQLKSVFESVTIKAQQEPQITAVMCIELAKQLPSEITDNFMDKVQCNNISDLTPTHLEDLHFILSTAMDKKVKK